MRTRSTRLKLIGAGSILALVFSLAIFEQFQDRSDPLRVPKDPVEVTHHVPPRKERPVFGKTPRTQVPRSAPSPVDSTLEAPPATLEPLPEQTRSRVSPNADHEIRDLIARWRDSALEGDLDAHASLYAPKMRRFFNKRHVTNRAVRLEKQLMFARYGPFQKYDISDVRLQSQGDDVVVVTFRKEWDTKGPRRFSGAERQRLTLERAGDRWAIAEEEELKVYWTRRS